MFFSCVPTVKGVEDYVTCRIKALNLLNNTSSMCLQAYDASAIFEAAQGRLQGGRFYRRYILKLHDV